MPPWVDRCARSRGGDARRQWFASLQIGRSRGCFAGHISHQTACLPHCLDDFIIISTKHHTVYLMFLYNSPAISLDILVKSNTQDRHSLATHYLQRGPSRRSTGIHEGSITQARDVRVPATHRIGRSKERTSREDNTACPCRSARAPRAEMHERCTHVQYACGREDAPAAPPQTRCGGHVHESCTVRPRPHAMPPTRVPPPRTNPSRPSVLYCTLNTAYACKLCGRGWLRFVAVLEWYPHNDVQVHAVCKLHVACSIGNARCHALLRSTKSHDVGILDIRIFSCESQQLRWKQWIVCSRHNGKSSLRFQGI